MAQPVGKPFLLLRRIPRPPKDGGIPTLRLGLSVDGLPANTAIEVSLGETDGTDDGSRRPERELGKLSGKVLSQRDPQGGLGIQPDAPLPTRDEALADLDDDAKMKTILVCLVLLTKDGPAEGYFRLSDQDVGKQEGDYWEVQVKGKSSVAGKDYDLLSPPVRMAHMPRAVPRGQATYFPRAGNRLDFYNDGCKDQTGSAGALKDMVDAIRAAQHFVFVVDWSFHPLFRPSRDGAGADASIDNCIGMELVNKATAGVTTAILTWDHTDAVKSMKDRQNDDGDDVLAAIAKSASAGPLTHDAGDDSSTSTAEEAAIAGLAAGAGAAAVLGGAKLAEDHHVGGPIGKAAHSINQAASNPLVVGAVVAGAAALAGGAVVAERALFGSAKLPANLYWRKTSRSGGMGYLTNSHHQKMVVVDYCEKSDGRQGIRVFLGGLDLTKGRFDHAEHSVAPAPGKGTGDGQTWTYAQQWKVDGWHPKDLIDEWYNAETDGDRTLPRQPWHDVHAKLDGPSAWDYLREFVGRWLTISGSSAKDDPVWKTYVSLCDRTKFWPPEEPLPDGVWTVQVCRSLEKKHWTVDVPKRTLDDLEEGQHWSPAYGFNWGVTGADYEKSIWEAYRRGIDVAERFIYIENQYFIGSGKNWDYDKSLNDIPERLVNKILERRAAGKDFHVYIVMPMFPEGKPVDDVLGFLGSPPSELRACEWETVKWMIYALAGEMGDDWKKYLSFYFLANWTNVPRNQWVKKGDRNDRLRAHQRYMIYVHTKMMIVDDRHVILGSCNLNDRGLTGNTDSEIVISAWPRLQHRDDCIEKVRDLRKRLWQEHLGAGFPDGAWLQPESGGCVKAVGGAAFANYRSFRQMVRKGTEGHLCLWNYATTMDNELEVADTAPAFGVSQPIRCPEQQMCLPDSPYTNVQEAKGKGWCWNGDFQLLIPRPLVK